MPNIRPVLHFLGLIIAFLGVTMSVPTALDFAQGNHNWRDFFVAMLATTLIGGFVAMASADQRRAKLGVREAWLLTAGLWVLLPAFAAIPLMTGAPSLTFTDAYFETVSGFTTTGSSVITGLDTLPRSVLLWRGMTNWMGGLGIAFVAMIFLPVMRVGGMQLFRTEGFDTFGKILPRAADIARLLLAVYAGLTALCMICFLLAGLSFFDALVHAMACVATGGFSNYDANFGALQGAPEYVGVVFMLASALPLILYVQVLRGETRPIFHDPQVRAILRWFAYGVSAVVAWRMIQTDEGFEPILRSTLFNLGSILTGTGFGSAQISTWGAFPLMVGFIMGMIGGCSGSTSGSVSVFRWLVFGAALRSALRSLHSPSRVAPPLYDGKPISAEIINPLMMFFTGYVVVMGVSTELIVLAGADFTSAFLGVWSSIGNIGYAIGPLTTRTGTNIDFNDFSTWVMTIDMLLGRLGLMALLVIFLPRFWRS